MTLSERIAARQASKTFAPRSVPIRTIASLQKGRYGRIEHELWQLGMPLMDAAFGILRRPEDLATLIILRGTGQPLKESRQKIDEFLRKRAGKAVTDLKEWLGLRRGRPVDISKQKVWAIGAALRKQDPKLWSWGKIAQKLDPKGHAENAQQARDRMRLGILSLRDRHARKNKPRP